MNFRIIGNPNVPRDTAYWMVDYSHPETPLLEFSIGPDGRLTSKDAERPDGRCLVVHADHEQTVRDGIARLGEHVTMAHIREMIEQNTFAKHDADCTRRKKTSPYLCTCGMTDEEVVQARARIATQRIINRFLEQTTLPGDPRA